MPRLGTVAQPLLLEFRNAWSRQIRALYFQQFMTKCPKSLHYLQTLAFLPNVLDINTPWSVLDIQTVASRMRYSHGMLSLLQIFPGASFSQFI